MGEVIPTNKTVLGYKGLHLYHSAMSNCSMRVRMALEEKGLPWESHHLDLTKKETHTPEYFGINPNGVVPALVHDGRVIIESDDIIEYLDGRFPQPPLSPVDPAQRAAMHDWLKLATGIHVKGVKTWIYHNRMRGKLKMSDAEMDSYRRLQTNAELLAFHEKSRSEEGFTDAEVERSRSLLRDSFDKLEAALERQEWLVGGSFSLADIAWVPLHFTLVTSNFAFDDYPHVDAWQQRIRARPSFQKGVVQWCPKF